MVGDAVENALIINNYLLNNQYNGDKLRRIFPRSITDYSIELTLAPNMKERVYSCVIDGASDQETTIFTYIVRNLGTRTSSAMQTGDFTRHVDVDVERMNMKTLNGTHDDEQNSRRVDHVIDHLRSSSDSPAGKHLARACSTRMNCPLRFPLASGEASENLGENDLADEEVSVPR